MSLWIRFFTIIVLIALHIGFVSVASFGMLAPVVLIDTAVAWTMILGFPGVLLPLCSILFITDNVLFGSVMPHSIYFIMVAYAVSFFTKRTILGDRSGFGILLLSLLSGVFAVGYSIFVWLLAVGKHFFTHTQPESMVTYWSMTFQSVTLSFVVTCFFYGILSMVLERIERGIRILRQQDTQYSIK